MTWQGRPAQPNTLEQLPITLTLKSGTVEVNYASQNTDSSGYFTQVVNLPAGPYTWRVKGPKYLAVSGPITLAPGTANTMDMGMLRTGDCDNNNIVNVSDFGILKAAFGTSVGQPGYDDRADFTGDQTINVNDFVFIKQNFGTGGAPPAGPGQMGK